MSTSRAGTSLTLCVATMAFFMTVSTVQTQTPQAVSAASYVARGHDWYKKGELDRAMADFNIALMFDARCANAYPLRGLVKQD